MSFSCDVNNVYCTAVGTAVGRKEKEGPLGRYFDIFYSNDKCGEKNYESGEIKLLSDAYASCLKRAKIKEMQLIYLLLVILIIKLLVHLKWHLL